MQNFDRAALRDKNGRNTSIKKLSPVREFRNSLIESDLLRNF